MQRPALLQQMRFAASEAQQTDHNKVAAFQLSASSSARRLQAGHCFILPLNLDTKSLRFSKTHSRFAPTRDVAANN